MTGCCKRLRGAYVLAVLIIWVVTAGCASTPQASRERDIQAKTFATHPGNATLYVYRTDTHIDDSVLWIDDRLIGATLPLTYFRVYLDPGKHVLTGMGYDNGRLTVEVRPDAVYFVWLKVSAGQSWFQQVPEAVGRQVLAKCCSLLENWGPGQRPLLR